MYILDLVHTYIFTVSLWMVLNVNKLGRGRLDSRTKIKWKFLEVDCFWKFFKLFILLLAKYVHCTIWNGQAMLNFFEKFCIFLERCIFGTRIFQQIYLLDFFFFFHHLIFSSVLFIQCLDQMLVLHYSPSVRYQVFGNTIYWHSLPNKSPKIQQWLQAP